MLITSARPWFHGRMSGRARLDCGGYFFPLLLRLREQFGPYGHCPAQPLPILTLHPQFVGKFLIAVADRAACQYGRIHRPPERLVDFVSRQLLAKIGPDVGSSLVLNLWFPRANRKSQVITNLFREYTAPDVAEPVKRPIAPHQ